MVRPPLSPQEHARGERLGVLLREARGQRSMTEIAAASGVPAETLRKIETGRIATPAFFTVAAIAAALSLPLEEIARHCAGPVRPGLLAVTGGRER
jgi:transcriptional regulator with XRE-family HTH domain